MYNYNYNYMIAYIYCFSQVIGTVWKNINVGEETEI